MPEKVSVLLSGVRTRDTKLDCRTPSLNSMAFHALTTARVATVENSLHHDEPESVTCQMLASHGAWEVAHA